MSGFRAVFRSIRQAIFAIGLCLLALSFAMEAKLARYGPVAGPGSEVRASKALPDDAPKVVQHGVPAPNPVDAQIVFAVLAILTVSCAAGTDVMLRRNIQSARLRPVTAAYFLPYLFFRPPPAR